MLLQKQPPSDNPARWLRRYHHQRMNCLPSAPSLRTSSRLAPISAVAPPPAQRQSAAGAVAAASSGAAILSRVGLVESLSLIGTTFLWESSSRSLLFTAVTQQRFSGDQLNRVLCPDALSCLLEPAVKWRGAPFGRGSTGPPPAERACACLVFCVCNSRTAAQRQQQQQRRRQQRQQPQQLLAREIFAIRSSSKLRSVVVVLLWLSVQIDISKQPSHQTHRALRPYVVMWSVFSLCML